MVLLLPSYPGDCRKPKLRGKPSWLAAWQPCPADLAQQGHLARLSSQQSSSVRGKGLAHCCGLCSSGLHWVGVFQDSSLCGLEGVGVGYDNGETEAKGPQRALPSGECREQCDWYSSNEKAIIRCGTSASDQNHETEFHYAVPAGLELVIFLPQSPKCWNYKCVPPPGSASFSFSFFLSSF
jgi:hypothetical protein